jgi:hypothetical protein
MSFTATPVVRQERIADMRTLIFTLAGVVALALSPSAGAQDPDPNEFTPPGYTFCGWKDFTTREWKMEWDDSLTGVFLIAYADGMTCRDARRNVSRMRYSTTPPYRGTRPGYRCITIQSGHEYSDVRCVRVGGTRKFRFQTGA